MAGPFFAIVPAGSVFALPGDNGDNGSRIGLATNPTLGVARPGDRLEVITPQMERHLVEVAQLQTFRRSLEELAAGTNGTIIVKGLDPAGTWTDPLVVVTPDQVVSGRRLIGRVGIITRSKVLALSDLMEQGLDVEASFGVWSTPGVLRVTNEVPRNSEGSVAENVEMPDGGVAAKRVLRVGESQGMVWVTTGVELLYEAELALSSPMPFSSAVPVLLQHKSGGSSETVIAELVVSEIGEP